MKENGRINIFSTILYIVAGVVFSLYLYWSLQGHSPFLRAGVLVGVCVCLYIGTWIRVRKSDIETAKKQMKTTFFLMFILYVSMLVTFLFFEGYFGRDSVGIEGFWNREEFSNYLQTSVNLVPFKSSGSLIYAYCKGWTSLSKPMLNVGGNLVAFMPFALFLPLFFEKLKKAVPLLISVAGIVIFVEITQLVFMRGVCDIDDLILNVGGVGIVFLILHTKSVRKIVDKLTFGLY